MKRRPIVSKATVTRLFVGSLIAGIAGTILGGTAVAIAVANDVFVMSGQDIVGVQGGALAWTLLGIGVVGGLAIAGAMIGGLVSWIGALLNTSQLESKTWFLVLLLLGIFSFGLFAMIAYVIAGPDGTRPAAPHTVPTPA
jgi:MFS family permease